MTIAYIWLCKEEGGTVLSFVVGREVVKLLCMEALSSLGGKNDV